MSPPPALDGVEHRYVTTPAGVTIHIAEAGPADGDPVMLVHGFPQHWWEWREIMGPLAADGYRVLCPDLRGAGWSDAPGGHYLKADMADDLAAVLDALGIETVKLGGHDWGGVVAFIFMLRHPDRVTRFLGVNTVHPWLVFDAKALRDAWRFWYQMAMLIPVIGPRVIADRKGRYLRLVCRWVGGGWWVDRDDEAVFYSRFGESERAVAGSRWYRSFQLREYVPFVRGAYRGMRATAPVLMVHGTDDPVITPTLLRGYEDQADDMRIEYVDGIGHWIVEQRPDLVLDRARSFFAQ